MELKIKQKENILLLMQENEEVGYIKYAQDQDKDYIIQSIVVSEKYRGMGCAKKLFDEFIKKAQNENKKIIPICSYAQKQFEKNSNLENILKKIK